MEENKVLVTELPLPFDEKDLEELKSAKCIIDYRGDGKESGKNIATFKKRRSKTV